MTALYRRYRAVTDFKTTLNEQGLQPALASDCSYRCPQSHRSPHHCGSGEADTYLKIQIFRSRRHIRPPGSPHTEEKYNSRLKVPCASNWLHFEFPIIETTKRLVETRLGTGAKQIYLWRFISSCRAPGKVPYNYGLTAICKFALRMYMSEFRLRLSSFWV